MLGGSAVVAGYLAIPEGLPRDVAYLLVGLSTVVAIAVAVRRHGPARARAWLWMAAGQLSWVVGDTLYSWYEDVRGVSPFPSQADVYYLAGYGLVVVGLAALVRARGRAGTWRGSSTACSSPWRSGCSPGSPSPRRSRRPSTGPCSRG